MRLLIIGASGSIGTHVRGRALAAGMEVVTAGRTGVPDALRHYHADLAEDAAPATVGVGRPGITRVRTAGTTPGS